MNPGHWEACETRRQETGIEAKPLAWLQADRRPDSHGTFQLHSGHKSPAPDRDESRFSCSSAPQTSALLGGSDACPTRTVPRRVLKGRGQAPLRNESLFVAEEWPIHHRQPACGGTKRCGCSEGGPSAQWPIPRK